MIIPFIKLGLGSCFCDHLVYLYTFLFNLNQSLKVLGLEDAFGCFPIITQNRDVSHCLWAITGTLGFCSALSAGPGVNDRRQEVSSMTQVAVCNRRAKLTSRVIQYCNCVVQSKPFPNCKLIGG